MLYRAFGEQRYSSGTTPTDYRYTGQLEQATIGLYYYGARWYDPALGRFTQPDTIVPLESQGVQAWDRYAYVNNSPMNHTDPTGHMSDDRGCYIDGCYTDQDLIDIDYFEASHSIQYSLAEIIRAITPDGRKDSFVFSLGNPSLIQTKDGMEIPTTLYWAFTTVYDDRGGIQFYLETLDIGFNPHLELNSGEQANPSDLFGAGLSLTKGFIWKDGFTTEQYYGEATSWGGGLDVVTADYYENFPGGDLKGLDIGASIGLPVSLWRISTFASRITPRIDFTFWSDNF